ncbi:TrkH family potassium uptake protein [Natronorubrum daqingense]|uniref:Potassium transporter TrkH n=1 Tax=Natronorubrum daqingense TaxID=588898 RepID=A0A1N7EQD4_9EURY|nr:TrkH family potassium uptake protein [Natronorubrum daqingense]APX97791.1 potassium transporter TrkH [Natronorubrum daqingense]SIR90308.1 trk system potassium uptake protein TrkH [Natronorubrum daqingense]
MGIRVDWRSSCSLTGTVLKWLAVPLSAPLLLAVFDGDSTLPFAAAVAATIVVGLGLEHLSDERELKQREAFLMVALTWLSVAVVGAIPFYLVGVGAPAASAFSAPVGGLVNALFESTSGLTTTGATVMSGWDFENQSRAILLWRQLIQWLGGLGILVVAIGLLSNLMVGGAQLMETETQTRNVRKLRPHLDETARLIWGLYVGLTVLAAATFYGLHLLGFDGNMDLFNAVSHAMTSVATAGFSPEPESIGAFSPAVQWAIMPFMILGATNFVLLYYITQGEFSHPFQSEEFRFYVGILVGFSALVAAVLWIDPTIDGTLEETVRHGLFNVVSLVTTTGYASADFGEWPSGATFVLFFSMFIGGMAGSTTCSIKSLRWLVTLKAFRRNLFLSVHPEAVRPIRLGDTVVDEDTIRDIYAYILLVLVIFFLLTVVVVVDAARFSDPSVTEFEAISASGSIFLNIGPAFGMAGPMDNYAGFPVTTRTIMIVMMWIGRIEIIPVLVLLTPAFWKS